jgi:hypothetical protein
MYSAAQGNAGGESFEAADAQASTQMAAAPAPSAESAFSNSMTEKGERLTGCAMLLFSSEEEFANAIKSGAEGLADIDQYYKPASLPEGAALETIQVSESSILLCYRVGDNTLIFEEYRTLTAEDIAGWRKLTEMMSDSLAHSFTRDGEYLWSSGARFNESGEMESTDYGTVNVYWTQDGYAFHTELPASFTTEDIRSFSSAAAVTVEVK